MALIVDCLQIFVVVAIVGEVLPVLFPSSIYVAGLADVPARAELEFVDAATHLPPPAKLV